MNKKVDEEFVGIKDIYVLQCMCTEFKKQLQQKEKSINKAIKFMNNFWKEKSYYESVENCLQFATMNEFEKEDLLSILQKWKWKR